MDPPAAATVGGEAVHAAPEPPAAGERDAKRRRAGAAARILSLGAAAAVMATTLALFVFYAAASAVLLLHLAVAARAFRSHRRSRYRVPALDPAPSLRRVGLSPADLGLLPSFAFASSPRAGASVTPPRLCAVCLEPARAGEQWRSLPACGHAFHVACVDRWLARSSACPVCRAAVTVSAR